MGFSEKSILVTGGAGFVGTHTVVQLLNEGFRVSIIDNLDNSVIEAVHRVQELVGPELSQKLDFNLVRNSSLLHVSFRFFLGLMFYDKCFIYCFDHDLDFCFCLIAG